MGIVSVSYTHLDVYKRQPLGLKFVNIAQCLIRTMRPGFAFRVIKALVNLKISTLFAVSYTHLVQKGDMIQISVADNGKGIKEDAKEKRCV